MPNERSVVMCTNSLRKKSEASAFLSYTLPLYNTPATIHKSILNLFMKTEYINFILKNYQNLLTLFPLLLHKISCISDCIPTRKQPLLITPV